MLKMIIILLKKLLSKFNLVAYLVTRNLALQQQVVVLKRSNKRPLILDRDRLFWILLSKYWGNWQDALIIVKPDTVVRWHRKGFKSFWKWKSRHKGPGKPCPLPTSW
jgi:hypothetical protein